MKSIKKLTSYLIMLLCFIGAGFISNAQPATVSYPVAVGAQGCTGSINSLNFYTYNETTNTLANLTNCLPWLRIGTSGNTGTPNSYTRSLASISYNPKDKNLYYFWTNGSGSGLRTYVWRWSASTTVCPGSNTTYLSRLDTLRSFKYDILGVAFDKDGNGYIVEFGSTIPNTGYLRSIDFSTGVIGPQKQMVMTGGATIYETSVTGDVAMSPNGQMYFAANNKLFTPDYASYYSASPTITTTYIDTIKGIGSGYSLIGLTYAQGELLGAYSSGSGGSRTCLYNEVNPLTVTNTTLTTSSLRSVWDFASIISGIGVSKNLVSVTPTGTPKQYTVVYDVYVKNYGNTDITNVQVTDDLTAINGAGNVSAVSTNFVSNPSGLVLNASFNGNSNKNLLSGTVSLPNYPSASNYAIIRITCVLSNINNGTVYNNSATATAIGFNGANLLDLSTNGTSPDLNSNDKPDDAGEDQPTPLLIAITPQTPPCSSLGQIFYNEDFGTGATGATLPVTPGGTTQYTGSTTQPLAIDRFMLATNANIGDNAKFISLADHTTGTGRMMIVNADANAKTFYSGTVSSLCSGQQYSLSFYAAFVGNSSYQTICNGFGGFKYPKVRMRVKDVTTGLIITEIATGDITSTSWNQYGMKWVMPSGYSSVIFELINEAQGGCGNDLAIDDIQFGTCNAAPVVSVSGSSNGCLGGGTTMNATLSDPSVIPGAIAYQWQISSDNITFNDIAGATGASFTIASVTASDVNKYYRVLVAASGNIGSPSCRYTSAGYLLLAKNSSTAPTSISKDRTTVCPGDAIILQASGGTLGTNANYVWYSGSCGGTYVGSGSSITVSPAVATTYYVRIEGDCNVTSCVSIAITFNCDIDADDDGIPDVTESNGVDPKLDDDFDGIPNWHDANYAGFTDTNGDGVNDNFDKDKDGVPNFLDRDSDNDGIPDVVEAGGGDTNGDGVIDNYTDTDGDGFSQNVDANNTGAVGSGSGLGLPDLDGDGVPNYIDLDSDNDGVPDLLEVYGTDTNNDGKLDYSGSFASNDADGDGLINSADGDANGDGTVENLAGPLLKTGSALINGLASWYPNKNFDADSKANPYDLDSDADGITDVMEGGFADSDYDGKIDGSYNSNGWSTVVSALASLNLPNRDGTGKANMFDIDSDDDGIPDNIEGEATAYYQLPSGVDSDGDGIDDSYDTIVGFGGRGVSVYNKDGDAYPDYIDLDTDGDGLADIIEGNDLNHNGEPDDNVSLTGVDTDNDGLDNRFDKDNSSAKGTSAFFGNGGAVNGPVGCGSITTVQKTYSASGDKDWRWVDYVLSLNFIGFKGVLVNNVVSLTWSISHDGTFPVCIVERSSDGVHFDNIQTINSKLLSGNIENYSYSDDVSKLTASKLYYRIKALENGGNSTYSKTIIISKEGNYALKVLINPVRDNLSVSISSPGKTVVTFYVLDMKGRRLDKAIQKIDAGNNAIRLPVTDHLMSGTYILEAIIDHKVLTTRFSVQ